MKLQNLTVIFIIIILPIILLQSVYISNGLKTINYQTLYDTGLVTSTHDAIYSYELNVNNDSYSSNAQTKREILNASIKMFERSLCKTCGISEFNTQEIENYIPAIVFGLYDGFYLYAPSDIPIFEDKEPYREANTFKNKHNLKSYIYYSEQIDDITIRYTLDNYVVVSGNLKDYDGAVKPLIKSGYLSTNEYNTYIDENDTDAKKYKEESATFTSWFNTNVADKLSKDYLKISDINNDPEDENSAFTQHKRKIIRGKIETVLNSVITAYAKRTWGNSFKMPKISEESWEKVFRDVSMITFFQGKNIGLTNYNGYCVLNSNNTAEYINPNLLYFIENNTANSDPYYHDIRCEDLRRPNEAKGYNVSRFNGKIIIQEELEHKKTEGRVHYNSDRLYNKEQQYTRFTLDNNIITEDTSNSYVPLACYKCINSSISTNTTIYDYIKKDGSATPSVKTAYWTSLARERQKQPKLTVPD